MATISFKFQSTRPSRGATVNAIKALQAANISIHAPIAGRDAVFMRQVQPNFIISIHAPLAGRDGQT